MQIIINIFNFIADEILSNYSIILGLVALVGLLLQKKSSVTLLVALSRQSSALLSSAPVLTFWFGVFLL